MNMTDELDIKKGDVSDWNEGNFKSMRLHDAQLLINKSKADPFSFYQGKFNYQWWFAGIDIVYGEGVQKYSGSETTSVEELKKEVEELMKMEIIFTCKDWTGRPYKKYLLENWAKLKERLEEFEFLVKRLNDKHGLSTRNVGTKGLF